MKGFVNGYYIFSLWAMRLAYLNLLWIVFTLLGLVVLGFFPSTIAMFAVVRKWVQGEHDIKIFEVFWKSFKKEFLKGNLLGYILAGIGYFLSIEFLILRGQESLTYLIASYGVIALFGFYVVILMYVFPIFSHFEIKPFQSIKWSFVIGIVHPILTVFLIAAVGLINCLAFVTMPAVLVFFGGSVTTYILMWGASKTFNKYEHAVA